jgi:hypothetical protein
MDKGKRGPKIVVDPKWQKSKMVSTVGKREAGIPEPSDGSQSERPAGPVFMAASGLDLRPESQLSAHRKLALGA